MRIYAVFLLLLVSAHGFSQTSAQTEDIIPKRATYIPEYKSTKSVAIGYGHLFFTHKSDVQGRSIEGAINDIGLSIGLKAIEHFYDIPALNAGLGYYVSGNTILGFLLSALAKKSEAAITTTHGTSSLSSAIVLSYGEQGIVKNIAQNLNLGINFYSKSPLLSTNIGIGPSVNFLFYNFSDADSRFMNAIGIGTSLDLELHFSITRLIAIPFIIHAGFYPLNFNTFDTAVKYSIENVFLFAIQVGTTFTY